MARFLAAASSPIIKSRQTLVVAGTEDVASIAAVNPAKSVILFSIKTAAARSGLNITFNSSTQINIARTLHSASANIEIIEFEDDVEVSEVTVSAGVYDYDPALIDVNLTEVNTLAYSSATTTAITTLGAAIQTSYTKWNDSSKRYEMCNAQFMSGSTAQGTFFVVDAREKGLIKNV